MTELATRPATGHLTVSPDQTFWTEDQTLVLKQTGIDNDVTRAELTGFLHLAQRTGLDPFSRQIYLIGRKDRQAGRKVFTPQTGIDGYRIVAQRTAERTGTPLSYDDTLWCGEDGDWHDVWLSKQPPAAAKVTVYRGSSKFSAVATYAEYAQTKFGGEPTAMWARMPAVMLAKCAESLALRKAFPHDLAGVYTAEEMGQADNGQQGQQERPAARQQPSAPVDDQWSRPAPDVEDAEIVGEDTAPAEATPPTPAEPKRPTKGQLTHLAIEFGNHGIADRDERLRHTSQLLDRDVTSFTTLTVAEHDQIRKALRGGWPHIDHRTGPPPAPGEYELERDAIDALKELEANSVAVVLTTLIADANSPATLNEAGRDIAKELARGSITPAEAELLKTVWKARSKTLAAMQQDMAMAGTESGA